MDGTVERERHKLNRGGLIVVVAVAWVLVELCDLWFDISRNSVTDIVPHRTQIVMSIPPASTLCTISSSRRRRRRRMRMRCDCHFN